MFAKKASTNVSEPSDLELVAALHDNPIFLPDPLSTIKLIITILGAIVVLHVALHTVISSYGADNKKKAQRTQLQNSHKATSLVMNGLLACIGFYHFYGSLPETSTVTERVAGEYEEFMFLPAVIIAYNVRYPISFDRGCRYDTIIWAIPVGLTINEPTEMIVHHCAVLVVGCFSGFFTNGFRYHNPFFFGLIETSSVPLVLMNVFREDAALDEKYPIASLVTSVSFAISFLITRVGMWIPQAYDFIRLAGMLCYTSTDIGARIMIGACVVVCLFLTGLQLFWASRIIEGIAAVLCPPPEEKSKER